MLAAQVLIAAIIIAATVISLIYLIFGNQIKAFYTSIKNRLEYENKITKEIERSSKEREVQKELALREARKEVEEMSLHIGQKGDPNCP